MVRRKSKIRILANQVVMLIAMSLSLVALETPVSAKVGITAAVNQAASGTPPGQAPRVLLLGANVVFNEHIATSGSGLVQVLLVDGTTFTIGPGSSLVIDEFVYDPQAGTAKLVATVAKGVFRFIGGSSSRTSQGATINTPVGTIGIRGGMVEGLVGDSDGNTFFSMLFGDEVNFTGNTGKKKRIYKSGFTLVVSGRDDGDTNIRRRNNSDSRMFHSALAGKPGTKGGANQQSTDKQVKDSPITEVNSGAPENVAVPAQRPNPVKSSDIETAEDDVAEIDIAAQERVVEAVSKPTRVVTAAPIFTHSFNGNQLLNTGPRGIVGGTANTDRVVGFIPTNGRLVGTTPNGDINLPNLSGAQGDNGTVGINVTDGTSPQGNLTGMAYAGNSDFVAYMLGINGNAQDPFYVFYGTETNIPQLVNFDSGTDIRQYSLTPDPIQNLPVPYLIADIYGPVTSFNSLTPDPIQNLPVPYLIADIYGPVTSFNSTNLFVVEPNQSVTEEAEIFSTWTDINGSGALQKSAINVLASSLYTDSVGTERTWSSRRGSWRHQSSAPSVNMRGSVGTAPGGSGGHFFGTNAEHFLIGQVFSEADTYYDGAAGPLFNYTGGFTGYADDGSSGTLHVASLVSETPQSSFSRTSRSSDGFMVGMNEQAFSPISGTPRFDNPFIVASIMYPNFSMFTDAQSHNFTAQGLVTDFLDIEPDIVSMLITFGAGFGSGGGNAFVDDDIFGATQNRGTANTRINYDNGGTANQLDSPRAGSYIVSGRAAPIAGYGHCSACDYADWGWWGTRVRVNDPGTTPATYGNRSEQVHMGTWVAGDITNPADMPTSMSATFDGTALGTVARNIGLANVQQYIARGDFSMTWDFGMRYGTLSISNFDGMNFGGALADITTGTQALFSGAISGSGANGEVSGAFVNNGAIKVDGVIGQFNVANGNSMQAVGTFMGDRQ